MLSTSKKILALSILSSTFISFHASAEIRDLREFLDFETDVHVAANLLVQEIRDDENKNHWPIPGCSAYSSLNLDSVDPNFTGTVELDDQTHLIKRIEITRVAFHAVHVPMFSNYSATLALSAEFTPDCSQIVNRKPTNKDLSNGSRYYTVTTSNSSIVDGIFKKDMQGREYNAKYYAYADVVFESLFNTNPTLRALCPNFVPHTHKPYCT